MFKNSGVFTFLAQKIAGTVARALLIFKLLPHLALFHAANGISYLQRGYHQVIPWLIRKCQRLPIAYPTISTLLRLTCKVLLTRGQPCYCRWVPRSPPILWVKACCPVTLVTLHSPFASLPVFIPSSCPVKHYYYLGSQSQEPTLWAVGWWLSPTGRPWTELMNIWLPNQLILLSPCRLQEYAVYFYFYSWHLLFPFQDFPSIVFTTQQISTCSTKIWVQLPSISVCYLCRLPQTQQASPPSCLHGTWISNLFYHWLWPLFKGSSLLIILSQKFER